MSVIKNRRTKLKVDNTMQNVKVTEGLPEVTSADNGKVLTVVDGAWDTVDAHRVKYFDVVADIGVEIRPEFTFAEVRAAYNRGDYCILRYKTPSQTKWNFLPISEEPVSNQAHFRSLVVDLFVTSPILTAFDAYLTPAQTLLVKRSTYTLPSG